MIFKTLYEANENNNELHRGIPEVALAEAEIKVFLCALNSDVRLAADALLGRLARAYEMQGFLFGGNVAGMKWGNAEEVTDGQNVPKKEQSTSKPRRKYFSSAMLPVRQLDYITGAVVAEFDSLSAAERATGNNSSAISKACKGIIDSCGGYLWEFAAVPDRRRNGKTDNRLSV